MLRDCPKVVLTSANQKYQRNTTYCFLGPERQIGFATLRVWMEGAGLVKKKGNFDWCFVM
jgi:hypothetical protein